MHQLPLTYQTLMQNQEQQVQLEQVSKQTAANRASALRLFLNAHHLTEQDVVGFEMRAEFSLAQKKLSEQLQAEGHTSRAITNIQSMLRRFREMVVAEDKLRAAATDAESPFRQAIRSLMEGQAVKRVAKQADVSSDMIFGWFKGKEPRPSNAKFIHRQESFFGIEQGSLTDEGGFRIASTIATTARGPGFSLQPYRMSPEDVPLAMRARTSARTLERIHHFACAAEWPELGQAMREAGFVAEQEALDRE